MMETRTYPIVAASADQAARLAMRKAEDEGMEPIRTLTETIVKPTTLSDGTFSVQVYGEMIPETERRMLAGDR